jgi:hypothetical protein
MKHQLITVNILYKYKDYEYHTLKDINNKYLMLHLYQKLISKLLQLTEYLINSYAIFILYTLST